MTKTEQVVEYLTAARGCHEVPATSKKYRKFINGDRCYFVGKNGAVRAGNTVSESVSLTDQVHFMMKRWAKEGKP